LIGPNGAGKTTAFNILTGVYQPTRGQVTFAGQNLSGRKPFQVCHLGLTRTFQNIRLFKALTVLQNVLIACHPHFQSSALQVLLQSSAYLSEEKKWTDHCLHLLDVFGLKGKAYEVAASLPYGEQRKLEIVRALATQPKMILLDEPAAGMNHSETHQLMDLIAKVRKEFNLTVLLIEHDMKLVMGICENIFVLDHGVKIEEGRPEKIQKSTAVIQAYLGVDSDLH